MNQQNSLSDDIKELAYKKFLELPLKSKLVIYAKLVHGNLFRVANNDLLDLNRRSVSTIYRSFIDEIKGHVNVTKKSHQTSSKLKNSTKSKKRN